MSVQGFYLLAMTADAFAPGYGCGAKLLFIQAGQAPVVEQLLAGDPKVFHTVSAGGIYKLRDRVVNGLLRQAGEVKGHQVGSFADFQ